jgi:hypothetical protein
MSQETRVAHEVVDIIARILGWVGVIAIVVSILSIGCTTAYGREIVYEQSLGYHFPYNDSFWRYKVDGPINVTRWGILYQGQVDTELLDTVCRKTLECLHATTRKSEFVVLIPPDWMPNCDHSGELLNTLAPSSGGCGKGLTPTKECPCRWRDGVRGPNILITPPSLYLLPRAIAVWAKGSDYFIRQNYNPWDDPEVAPCLGPFSPPLHKQSGKEPLLSLVKPSNEILAEPVWP